MKKLLLILLISIELLSCNSNSVKNTKSSEFQKHNFTINGLIDFKAQTAYLNTLKNDSLLKIDSSTVIKNAFLFKGKINSPKRFAITFKKYSAVIVFILENKNIDIIIKKSHLNNPIISGSLLNTQLIDYKNNSKNIFKRIDYLYPRFQKARLENDIEKLTEIKQKIEAVNTEFTNYSFDYIKKNSNSYIAAMLLVDHLKASKIDTLQIKNSYTFLSKKVQNSYDGKIVSNWLQLQ